MTGQHQISVLERHFQSAIQIALVAICGWVALTTHNTAVSLKGIQRDMTYMQGEIDKLRNDKGERYTKSDALRDMTTINNQFDVHNAEINDLSERVRQLELEISRNKK